MTIQKITQKSPRGFSDWFVLGPKNYDYCCDCGLCHENQFRVAVDERRKKVTVYMRSRRAKTRTHKRRKQRKLYSNS